LEVSRKSDIELAIFKTKEPLDKKINVLQEENKKQEQTIRELTSKYK
jgi:hypothetical protein